MLEGLPEQRKFGTPHDASPMSSSILNAEQPGLVVAQDAQLFCEHTATLAFTNSLTSPLPFRPSAKIYFEEGFRFILSIEFVEF